MLTLTQPLHRGGWSEGQTLQSLKGDLIMSPKEMVRYWRWLLAQGDLESAKEVEYDFFDAYGESIFDYA